MTEPLTQAEKYKRFHHLHHSDRMLLLPNIWDSLGALLLQDLGYPAIATASAAVALSNGYQDGEHIGYSEVLSLLKRICTCVDLPVTADIESGFADDENTLSENIRQLLHTGVVGINIEDTDKKRGTLYPIEEQIRRIRIIKQVSSGEGLPLFLNARTDVYLRGPAGSKPDEALRRGKAYKEAGADCFFPLAIREQAEIEKIVTGVQLPVNVLLIPGVPPLATLEKLGVNRVSLGPGFLKIAIRSLRDLALKLRQYEGLEEITGNNITSDYLSALVSRKG